MTDFKRIEQKWQKEWEKNKVFEVNPDKRKKFFVNAPYPYINAFQHIGHLYTYMRTEAFARYKRLQRFNVLFPQGWHATGSPIVNAAKRIKQKEAKQLKIMKDMGIVGKELKKFENPKYWIKFFIPEFKKDYKSIGMSIDWRREFHTTSLNPSYDKFIRWQFRKLKEKKYCIQGRFPVVWDPKENTAVGDHARVEGEGEVPQEFILVKHKLDDGKFVISATLRQDTILGITNLYVDPDIEYVEIEINNEKWILGEEAVKKLEEQDRNLKIKKKVKGKDLIGKKTEEVDGHKVLILPATFLDPKFGTGLVHSVPSDSADDLIALWDLQKDDDTLNKFGLDSREVKAIKPIPVLDTPGYGGVPAEIMLKKYGIKSQNDRGKLEKIKQELYKLSFHTATFNEKYKKGFSRNLQGVRVSEGKDIIKQDLLKSGWIDTYYQLTGKVVSRSLTECIVKIVDNQWFLNYADKEWKKKTHECLNKLKLYPEKARQQFEYVVDWLHEWACTREEGLGTKLPWDEKWLIESLSDSTIYMAYYTIAHLIKDIPINKIDDAFFDYVFLGKGKKPNIKNIDNLKKEFEYWYPVDFRNSGKDLIQNHLTFFLFNHVAIFPKKYWPKGIGTNGWVTVDGQKMSKSLGNMMPVREMVKKFGADASRLTILNGGESLDDPNWDNNFASNLKVKFNQIFETISNNYGKGRSDISNYDKLAQSRANRLTKQITPLMEETLFRSAIQKIFFDYWKLIKDYLKATDQNPNKKIFKELIDNFLIMLSAFCPHITEELWEKTGNKPFISLEKWPVADEKKIDEKLEQQEQQIENLAEDINNIVRLVKEKQKKEMKKAFVYVLPQEKQLYSGNKETIKKKTALNIEISAVNDPKKYDPQNKSKKAKPGKPAIYIE